MNENFKKIVDIIVDVADIPEGDIKEDSMLIDDLDLASLEVLAIMSKIEEQFSVAIDENDLLGIQTVNDIIKLISSKQA